MKSLNSGKLDLKNLPPRFYNICSNTLVLINTFHDVLRFHIREYTSFEGLNLYPTEKGVAFYHREWKYMCKVLQAVQQKYQVPRWDGMNDISIPASEFGIQVTETTTQPGTFKLGISKKVTSKNVKTFECKISLNEKQSAMVSLKCEDVYLGDLMEKELYLKIDSKCYDPDAFDRAMKIFA
ncbi:hypothetical protein JTE90_015872 [Oedothorax gibbosus]|uniref:Uncharacterized protein n=1 Tax=Oedothorax gibbosus TaxID=931172 RepID=A0AAV6VUW6_9ARAC|nr:hypothetical protein JTE90_015872 [Oedothorax gibbosus]